jgi:hypothetical protein
MKCQLLFSVTAPSRDTAVTFLIEEVQVAMVFAGLDPVSRAPLFQAVHVLTLSSFPHDLNYCYLLGDDVRDFSLRIHFPPLIARLHIFDDLAERPSGARPNTFSVTFRIFKSVAPGASVVLVPVAARLRQGAQSLPMSPLPHGFWTVTTAFACTAPAPFLYKYSVSNGEFESGNAHTLFVSAPIGGAHVTVYDAWQGARVAFPYRGRPLQPLQQEPANGAYRLEIVAADSYPAISATFSDLPRARRPLCLDGAWALARDIPAGSPGFEFAVFRPGDAGAVRLEGARVLPGPRSGVVLSRYAFGPAFRRGAGAYAPLASLRAAGGAAAGDFRALVAFAAWAKGCGLQHVHAGLEWLPGQQLDPVHAAVECAPRERTLHALREAKIAALSAQYRAWAAAGDGRAELREFLARCPWLAAARVSDFGAWVQWRLWRQLSDAYLEILQLGMQLMIDVVVERAADWPARVVAAARCADIVHVVGIENALLGEVHVEAVRAALPSAASADLFLTHFCTVADTRARLNSWIVDQRRVGRVLESLQPAERQAQSAALVTLITQAMQRPMKAIHCLAGDAGAALVLEARMAAWLGWRKQPTLVWDRLGMVPATDDPAAPAPSFLMPRRLSPEQISEFPAGTAPAQIRAQIEQRAGSHAQALTVYLHDLLVAEAGVERLPPAALQEIQGHCRFLFPFTVADLRASQEITDRVRAFVERSNRAF